MSGDDLPRASTGVTGLDDILGGGLPVDRLYLVQGTPGVGKTTLALQFLLEGARRVRSGATVKLVAVTGYGQADDVKRALDAGFAAHLKKPVGLNELEDAMRAQ